MNNVAKLIFGFITAMLVLFILPAAHASDQNKTVFIINGAMQTLNDATSNDDIKKLEYESVEYNRFTDYAAGYSLLIPRQMTPDISAAAVRTVFFDESAQIEVYYDDFTGTISSASDYVSYGNHPITAGKNHTVTKNYWTEAGGYRVHVLEYHRSKLARIANDKNYYVSAEIIKNENEVYTLFIKSDVPIENAPEIIDSFRLIDKQGSPRNYLSGREVSPKLNPETVFFQRRFFSPQSTLTWGIFEPSAPETMRYLEVLENKVEYRFPFLIRYHGLDESVPLRGLTNAYESSRYVELTLQTTYSGDVNALMSASQMNDDIMYAILDGKYDDYFRDYARKLKDFGHPVLFRLNNEMNGDWCWYSAYYTGKDTDIYKSVWRYIHSIFTREGVDNVLWVWNPHDVSRPDFKWNHYLMYYPGDEYVDIIGLTGYNTGTYFPGEYWREFEDIYRPLYTEYTAAFTKPFIITEFGSNSVGGDKTAWINSMFDLIGEFPNIKAAIWWSGIDYDQQGNAGRIYKLDETEKTVEVFHKRFQEYNNLAKISPQRMKQANVTLEFPQLAGPPSSTVFNQIMHAEAHAFIQSMLKPDCTGSMDYRVEMNRDEIISVTLKKFSYQQHAAHPLTVWKSFTFNTKTGKMYTLKNLFKNEADYETEINRRIAWQIIDKNIPLLRPFKGVKPDQEYYLTRDCLVIYFHPYEYTPYYFGFLSFAIPLEDISPLLVEEIAKITANPEG